MSVARLWCWWPGHDVSGPINNVDCLVMMSVARLYFSGLEIMEVVSKLVQVCTGIRVSVKACWSIFICVCANEFWNIKRHLYPVLLVPWQFMIPYHDCLFCWLGSFDYILLHGTTWSGTVAVHSVARVRPCGTRFPRTYVWLRTLTLSKHNLKLTTLK